MIVKPIKAEDCQSRQRDPLFKALQVSGSKQSKYNLTTSDRKNGFYFIYKGLEVPLKVLFNDNQKTAGILGVAFGTAKDCPSQALGLCQLPNDKLCYARAGEKRATRKNNGEGLQGMDSYLNGLLCSYFWDLYEADQETRDNLEAFLVAKDIKTLRFNLKGDFRHEGDILAIEDLARRGFNLTGYTARDDLADLLDRLGSNERVILNGSNRKYTNRFKAVDSLEEFIYARFKCLGSCDNCKKCYTLRGEEITVLVHGSGSDTQLNNEDNRIFITEWFKLALDITFKPEDFREAKGLTTCINKRLARFGSQAPKFANIKEVLRFMKVGGI